MEYIVYREGDELYHHGIRGQRWGVRRFQNEDGSLTPAGEKRYDESDNTEHHTASYDDVYKKLLDLEKNKKISKKDLKSIKTDLKKAKGKEFIEKHSMQLLNTFMKAMGDSFGNFMGKMIAKKLGLPYKDPKKKTQPAQSKKEKKNEKDRDRFRPIRIL
jgi:hypothetical protein